MKSKILLVLAISTSSAALYAQSGNVGIGNTTPATKLHVTSTGTGGAGVFTANTANMALRLENSGNGQSVIQHFLTKDAGGVTKEFLLGINPTANGNGVFYFGRTGGVNDFIMDLGNGNLAMSALPEAAAKLTIGGSLKVVDGTQGAGKVLTSDANGLASWQTPAAGIAGDYDWMKSGNAFPNSPGDTAVNIYHIGGNVGIGTTTPTGKLHVYNGTGTASGAEFKLESESTNFSGMNEIGIYRSNGGAGLTNGTTVGRIAFWGRGTSGYLSTSMIESHYTNNVGYMIFTAGGGEAMRLTELNKVGIGTPTPTGKLTVSGSGAGLTPILTLTNTNVAGNPTLNIYPGYTSNVAGIVEGNQNGVVFDQDPGLSNAGAGQSLYDFHGQIRSVNSSTLSDRRLKENIYDMKQYGLKEVMQMQPRNYTMKKYQTKEIGFIAQELKQIVPELVMGKETENSLLSVDYSKVCLVLINAIKDQQAQIEALKTANTGLKAEVSKVEQLRNELNVLKAGIEKLVNTQKPELVSVK